MKANKRLHGQATLLGLCAAWVTGCAPGGAAPTDTLWTFLTDFGRQLLAAFLV